MKKITLLFTVLFSVVMTFGQCPTVDILLTSQAEIDDFATMYPNCSQLTHLLRIDGNDAIINNLNGLSAITDAQDIFILKTVIGDFTGLNNLLNVRNLTLWFNNNIQNLVGFSSLQEIESLEMFRNNRLINLSGLTNIQFVNGINLFENNALTDLTDLSFMTSVNSFVLGGNSISTLAGLENLQQVTGDFFVSNELLEDFNNLENLQSIGGSLYIMNNNNVLDISAFNNISSLVNLYVVECPNLQNMSGLQGLQTVDEVFRIGFNTELRSLVDFTNIISVGNLDIYENEKLISLRGLDNLEIIYDRLFINNNPQLIAIQPLRNVDPTKIKEVVILNNINLSICRNDLICAIIEDDSVEKTIVLNAPGCNSVEEVLNMCLISPIDIILNNQLRVYPNPVVEILTILPSENISYFKAIIYSVFGEKLIETSEKNINFSKLPKGIYFVEIATDKGTISKKIVKK